MDSNLGNKKTMAKNIKRYMELHDIDRLKLSKDTGIKYTTIVGWLTEKTYPRIDKIEILANYFGIQKKDLVEEQGDDFSIRVSSDEYRLVESFKNLNEDNKKHLLDYVGFLSRKED